MAALSATTGAVLAGALGTAEKPLQFDLVTRATSIDKFVDIGPPGPSPGDVYVFTDDVFRPPHTSTAIGHFNGQCTLLDPSTARWDCGVATSLPDGTIRGDGTLTFARDSLSLRAITGGTGRYRNARGEGSVDLGPLEGPHTLHYSLITSP